MYIYTYTHLLISIGIKSIFVYYAMNLSLAKVNQQQQLHYVRSQKIILKYEYLLM